MLMDIIVDNVSSSNLYEDQNNHHNQRRRCRAKNASAVGMDVNFNSPEHRSSQDGSFIQDEDMHLILDFGPPKSAVVGEEKALPSANISDSWRGRNVELATDFDANVAQLDFDEFSTGDMMNLKGRRYVYDVEQTSSDVAVADCNNRNNNNNINRILMRNSLDFSLALSGGSLFSSIDAGDRNVAFDTNEDFTLNNKNIISPTSLLNDRHNGLAFISADSLDISSLSMHEENLKAACATNKREYMLTFDNKTIESQINVLASSSFTNEYRDAKFSDATSNLSFIVDDADVVSFKRNSIDCFPTKWAHLNELSSFGNVGKCVSLPNLRRRTSAASTRKRFLTDRIINRTEKIVLYDASSTEKSLDRVVYDVDQGFKIPNLSSGYSTANDSQQHTAIVKEDAVVDNIKATIDDNNQTENYQPKSVLVEDYEYSEFYLNGRYIDVNHNEIGYVPPTPSSRMIPGEDETQRFDVWNGETRFLPPVKPTRTFATLLDEKNDDSTNEFRCYSKNRQNFSSNSLAANDIKHSSTQLPVYLVDQSVQTIADDDGKLLTVVTTTTSVSLTTSSNKPIYTFGRAPQSSKFELFSQTKTSFGDYFLPDLSFMKFPFVVPALFPSAPLFPVAFLNGELPSSSALGLISLQQHKAPPQPTSSLNEEICSSEKVLNLPDPPKFAPRQRQRPCSSYDSVEDDINNRRDSGLGSSGPMHIQDWESLATLLPKEVVQACSFFKTNSNLLRDESSTGEKKNSFGRKNSRPVSDTAFCQRQRERSACCVCRVDSTTLDHRCHQCRPTTCCGTRCACTSASHACQPTRCYSHCARQISACRCCTTKISSHCCKSSTNCNDVGVLRRRKHDSFNRRRKFLPQTDFSETTTSDDDDDDEGDYCLPNYVRNTYSDYFSQRNADYSYFNDVPKFYSLQNVKELNDLYGQPVGYPLKRPKIGAVCQCSNDSSSSKPCATCFRVRSPSAERRYHDFYCDCRTSDIMEERKRRCTHCRPSVVQPTNIAERTLKKLNEEEKAAQKTRVYRQKHDMVNRAVCVCDELVSNLSQKPLQNQKFNSKSNDRRSLNVLAIRSLCSSIECLVADGLLPGRTVWIVVQASATLGPATKSIHELVTDLKMTEGNSKECSLKFYSFVRGLLRLRSLDCWLSYLVLKDKILRENYEENSFLQKATSAYKTLFNRLIMGVQPLSMLTFDVTPTNNDVDETNPSLNFARNFDKDVRVTFQTRRNDDEEEADSKKYSLIPTRLPSDSRIPKSSSVPSKLVGYSDSTPKSMSVDSGLTLKNKRSTENIKKSRIPLLKSSRSCLTSNKMHVPTSQHRTSIMSDSVVSMDASVFDEGSECGDEFNGDDGARYVCAIDTVVAERDEFLSFFKGETLILLDDFENGYVRCRRDDVVGLVDRSKVTYVTFL